MFGANHKPPTHFTNPSFAALRSTLKGKTYFGLIRSQVEAFFTTNGVSQYGQLDEVTLGAKVVEDPQLSHFTVDIVCFSDDEIVCSKKLVQPHSLLNS